MNQGVAGNNLRKLRVLVAPLDWGLGHATRCLPIIRTLEDLGCEPVLAGEGAQAALLGKEFPHLRMLDLPGYRVRYGSSAGATTRSLLGQSGKILRAIDREHGWLKRAVKEYGIDAVISDNRFGLYHETIPCVFITHQLRIQAPFGRLAGNLIQRWNYRHIQRFSECWIPDWSTDGLSGELSHPRRMPGIPVHYLGPLSRFHSTADTGREGHLLVLLSGPEPQRTIFERIILSQLPGYTGAVTLVRGLPGEKEILPATGNLACFNHLPADALEREMENASLVISRSGYSTVMDLVTLRKKSVLVPTPGQTEQEYLARHLEKTGIAPSILQEHFELRKVVKAAEEFGYRGLKKTMAEGRVREELQRWISSIYK